MNSLLTSVSVDEGLRKLLSQKTDPTLIRQRQQGSTKLSYITGYSVVRKLNNAFGYAWNWKVDEAWIEDVESENPRNSGKVCHVLGTLTALVEINGSLVEISKQAYGSKIHINKVGTQDNQNLYKVASTDALKKAASMFGIGADLYLKEEEQEFLDIEETNLWPTEMIEKHREDWNYIEQVQKEFDLTDEDLNDVVADYSNGKIKSILLIKPEDFHDFVEALQEMIRQQGAE